MKTNRFAPIQRIAILSVHTSPLASLGGEKTGGMNVYIRDFSREVARHGIQVDIFTRQQSADAPQILHDEVDGVRVIHIEAGPQAPISVNSVSSYLDQFVAGVRQFTETHSLYYELIHSHYWLSGLVAEALRSLWGVPFVQMFHTLGHMKNQIAQSESERASQERLDGEARVVQRADRLIAATATEKAQLIEWYAADPARIVTIPPGVDLSRFQPVSKNLARDFLGMPRQGKQILFTGRVEPLKGIDVLINAVAYIQRHRPELLAETQVSIIGGDPTAVRRDPEMVRLQELRCERDLCHTVRFLGAKDQSLLPYFYAAADMVVMPSHYESFGLVALEAMAMGTPVIASDVGGLAHLVRNGETGFLIPRNHVELFAMHMIELLTDENLQAQLGKQATAHAHNFEWKQVVNRMFDEVYLPLTQHSPFNNIQLISRTKCLTKAA